MLFFAIAINQSRAYEHNRAQKIILASATFDPEGRLMVLPDGTVPTKEITDVFREKVGFLSACNGVFNTNLPGVL